MPSYNRNSRNPLQTLTWAVAATLLSGSALAADAATKFEMTAYTNGAGGESIISGNYAAAVAALQSKWATQYQDQTTVDTNKCVAYTMSGNLAAAHAVCDSAIMSAKDDLMMSTSGLWEREKLNESLAVAYSNRAVLNWVSNDAVAAARDLAAAVELEPKAEYVARNISALHSPHENSLAQLGVTPRS